MADNYDAWTLLLVVGDNYLKIKREREREENEFDLKRKRNIMRYKRYIKWCSVFEFWKSYYPSFYP